MGLIKGYKEGSNITILNNWYRRPAKKLNDKYDDGSMTVVYRDNDTGEKHCQYTKNPKCRFYIAKKDENITTNELFYPEDKLDKIICPYKDQLKTIAQLTGNTEIFFDNLKSGNMKANNILYTNPRIFDADYDIENHWREIFDEQYLNEPYPISTAYMDIEVDGINAVSDFPEPGECPINAISCVDIAHNKVHVFLLENVKNPLIYRFKSNINKGFKDKVKKFVFDVVGGWKNAVRFGIDKLDYEFHFYKEEDEIRLIQDLFIIINSYKPDFVLAWNMAFDIPYIIARIQKLGYNPADIMCHPDFDEKIVKYFVDDLHYNEYADRCDYAIISSYSVFIDQMIQFASRRKQTAFRSYKLDYIGQYVANVRKYDYSNITTNLVKLPYLDYETFVLYNIVDTIVQVCIESRTGDTNYLFSKCLMNNTKYAKAHRQTIYLRNRAEKSFRTENDKVYVIGNNINAINTPTDTFKGAFVADARKITDFSKKRINGVPVMLFDNLVDYDYKSLYPSTMRQMNMAPNTIFGFIDIPDKIFDNENRYGLDRFVRGGSFLEDLQSHVFLEFGSRWLGLADYAQLYEDIKEYLAKLGIYVGYNDYYNNRVNPFIENRFMNVKPNPFIINKEPVKINPFIITNPINEDLRLTEEDFKEANYVNIKF